MRVDWAPLRRELSRWRADARALPLWWRDDDAVSHTPALERLAGLSAKSGLPVHLAVIPERADQSLSAFVLNQSQLLPVVHGWAHANHAPKGQKKAEFGQPRTAARNELSQAIDRLREMFGPRLVPMFVPPWNRFDPSYAQLLSPLGYRVLSTYGPRPDTLAAPGLEQVNTHIDPIDWKGTRGLLDPQILVERIVSTLRQRRSGEADADEPLGYLTHHLVHDDAVWTFSSQLISELLDGGASCADATAIVTENP